MIEQAAGVLRHQRRAIGGLIVQLLALAVPAIVDGNDAEAVADEQADPTGLDPVEARAGGKAVDEQDRCSSSLVKKGDAHAVGSEGLHAFSLVGPLRVDRWNCTTLARR